MELAARKGHCDVVLTLLENRNQPGIRTPLPTPDLAGLARFLIDANASLEEEVPPVFRRLGLREEKGRAHRTAMTWT